MLQPIKKCFIGRRGIERLSDCPWSNPFLVIDFVAGMLEPYLKTVALG